MICELTIVTFCCENSINIFFRWKTSQRQGSFKRTFNQDKLDAVLCDEFRGCNRAAHSFWTTFCQLSLQVSQVTTFLKKQRS